MRTWKILVPVLVALVGCQLCAPSESKSPQPPTASGPAPLRPGVIPLTPANTTIGFTGATSLTSHSGHFADFNGTWDVPTDNPTEMALRVTIDMASTTTKIGLLTKHLKADDFFDVAKYPTAEFATERITPTGETGQYQVAGRLTMHGVQKAISFPARIATTADEVTFDATITLRQTEFGMTEAAAKTKDEVPVTVSIRGRRR